ncbi:regulatory protein RecX [uncultured Senegalimassilia sp.]|uniref:regulatory protein RecX n=1 Tax=uncultured Senegalimassilia sp. TaxID=1714350 RepID=UPI00262C5332|nr:regulatory protein RecX [uncultured Senegalimassilia sp.]
MHDARMQSIADLRAQIRAIEAGSGTNGRSETHSLQCEGKPLSPDNLEHREDAINETQQKPVSCSAGCPILGNSENDGLSFEQSKQSDKDRDQADSAFAKIQRLLCIREHASALLHKRLLASGYDERIASEAVQRAIDCGLVSDERYADVLVRSRLSQRKGLRGIAFELEQADIDPHNVPAYQEALFRDTGPDELARALSLLAAKPPKAKRIREAAYRKLVQKGYESGVAASAARIFSEQHDCTTLETC